MENTLPTVPIASILTLVLLITITVGVTTALLAWRDRSEPGAKPLVAMLFGQCWWSIFLVFQLEATTLAAKLHWVNVSWIGVVIIPVAWLLFALEYTGRDHYIQPRYVAAISVVPAVTVLLALTGEYHNLLYVDSKLVQQGGRTMIELSAGPWYWVIAGYTYLLGVLGSIPLLGLISSDALPFRAQSGALLVGTLAPWASNALHLAGMIPVPGLDPTPIAFTISGVAYLGALRRFRLFRTSPAPNRSARRLVFERMHEGAVVVDSHDFIVDVNENATDILGVTLDGAKGQPAGEIIPGYEELPENGQASDHVTISRDDGTHFYDVTVTRIDDFHDRSIGRVITFHDVGEHLRQQQRLEVLNRVLRHNIRTETNLISGYADVIEDEDGWAATIKDHAVHINELGEKAREIADMFEREGEPAEAASLDGLLSRAVATVRDEHPEVTLDYEPTAEDVNVARVLDPVFSNVVENAAQHNTNPEPRVRIRVETSGDHARISVADNGPGIHEYERSVLERGRETSLEHGSGLGLWLIKWGTAIAGGEVTFDANDPSGSIITVEVPVLSRAETRRREPERVAP